MQKFKAIVWCENCRNDVEGCFGGSSETIGSAFGTWDDAQRAAAEYCGNMPYNYRVEEEDGY